MEPDHHSFLNPAPNGSEPSDSRPSLIHFTFTTLVVTRTGALPWRKK